MYEILNFFKIIIDFALSFMQIPIDIYGVDITMWEVFIYVFIATVLLAIIYTIFSK